MQHLLYLAYLTNDLLYLNLSTCYIPLLSFISILTTTFHLCFTAACQNDTSYIWRRRRGTLLILANCFKFVVAT